MPGWLNAALWGWCGASALLLGCALGYWLKLSQRLVAAIMAFGSGVLVSALSLELMEQAYRQGGILPVSIGFLAGAFVYTIANVQLAKHGGRNRKRSQAQQPSEKEKSGSGMAIAIGAFLDGIPESIAVGLSLLDGKGVSTVMVIAIFLSNVPEGLSSASGMKKAGRSLKYIFGVWGGIFLASGFASLLGYTAFQTVSIGIVSAIMASAAGAILAMLADTMIPEAFEIAHNWTGMITVAGFLAAFFLSKLSGS